ncbi:MAG: hypothetical protein ACOH1T_10210 [Microbacteriaceae bacterium]
MAITRTASSVIAGAAVTLLLLTGCSAGQSKAEACVIMKNALTDISTVLTDNQADLAGENSEKAAATISDGAKDFTTATKKVTNDEVKPAAKDVATAITALSDAFTDLAADPANGDPKAIQDAGKAASDKITAVGAVCK